MYPCLSAMKNVSTWLPIGWHRVGYMVLVLFFLSKTALY